MLTFRLRRDLVAQLAQGWQQAVEGFTDNFRFQASLFLGTHEFGSDAGFPSSFCLFQGFHQDFIRVAVSTLTFVNNVNGNVTTMDKTAEVAVMAPMPIEEPPFGEQPGQEAGPFLLIPMLPGTGDYLTTRLGGIHPLRRGKGITRNRRGAGIQASGWANSARKQRRALRRQEHESGEPIKENLPAGSSHAGTTGQSKSREQRRPDRKLRQSSAIILSGLETHSSSTSSTPGMTRSA